MTIDQYYYTFPPIFGTWTYLTINNLRILLAFLEGLVPWCG